MREKMKNTLWKFENQVKTKVFQDERGDSNMVAVIVLIVIILAVAVIFRGALLDAVTAVMDQFTDFINS